MTTTTPPAYRRVTSSAAAKAARIVEVASHLDDTTAAVWHLTCDGGPDHLHQGTRDVVTVQTDGAGFLALVDHFELVVSDLGGNAYGVGRIGLLDLPVTVFTGLDEAIAAGLVTA